ncbi:MAG: hypothetical protein GF411_03660 [Candidatus Lokiarchaeota archaeon]|nr:hypothetical protein [Candidatus Lokiarchaeota archaeon]
MKNDMRRRIEHAIAVFKKKGATSEKTALTLKELGLPRLLEYVVNSPMGERLPFVQVDDRFYLSKDKLAEFDELPKFLPQEAMKPWLQSTSSVPRGYLRYKVLQLLRERAMSGSEITSAIEEETQGEWTPSPGSLYPLLKKLKEDSIIELSSEKGTLKRYKLTELGEALFNKEMQFGERMRKRFQSGPFPLLPFIRKNDELVVLQDTFRDLVRISMSLAMELVENPSKERIAQVEKILKSTKKRLEEILEETESE